MEYIRIMNEASNPVPRIYLEKLGISTKRDEDQTIGQFGSGVKFAPIAALRNDWEWIFAGADVGLRVAIQLCRRGGEFRRPGGGGAGRGVALVAPLARLVRANRPLNRAARCKPCPAGLLSGTCPRNPPPCSDFSPPESSPPS